MMRGHCGGDGMEKSDCLHTLGPGLVIFPIGHVVGENQNAKRLASSRFAYLKISLSRNLSLELKRGGN
jgi:hypothetical protein